MLAFELNKATCAQQVFITCYHGRGAVHENTGACGCCMTDDFAIALRVYARYEADEVGLSDTDSALGPLVQTRWFCKLPVEDAL